jgi:hypothetical protein
MPCTLTQPGLRHGAIRIAKTDLDIQKAAADSTLDWTAFQIAILGGVGDYYTGGPDFWPTGGLSDEEESDHLATWFADFGFESPGRLLGREDETAASGGIWPGSSPSICQYNPPSPVPTLGEGFDDDGFDDLYDDEEDKDKEDDDEYYLYEDEVLADVDLPIPIVSEYPTGFWNESGAVDTSRFVTDGCGIKRWTVGGHPKPYTRASSSPRLSPQSHKEKAQLPTTSITTTTTTSPAAANKADGDGDVVLMGYNLGYDLGDFLRWEAEHVYAGSLYTDKY